MLFLMPEIFGAGSLRLLLRSTLNALPGRVWRGSAFGGYRSRIDVPKLVERYMNKEIRVDEYVTDVMGLDDINKAFKAMTDGLCLRCVVLMP